MRKHLALALGILLGAQSGAVLAQSTGGPVVVELYTSQGCSSCPPADALLQKLARRDDVIALALHVDYWDYLGWKDDFASPQFTKRQKAYAHFVSARTVYTPQMVVQGQEHLVGLREMELADLITAHKARARNLSLRLRRQGSKVQISAPATSLGGKIVVQLVRYTPEQTVDIERGENRGRRIAYANIVTSWEVVGEWDGKLALSIEAKAQGDAPVVVILQAQGPGAILAAAQLR